MSVQHTTHVYVFFFLKLNWFSICPGRHFSAESLWLISAHMTATMDIGKAIDENGSVITPSLEFTTGFVRFVFPPPIHLKKVVLFISFPKVIRNRSDVVLGRDRNKL